MDVFGDQNDKEGLSRTSILFLSPLLFTEKEEVGKIFFKLLCYGSRLWLQMVGFRWLPKSVALTNRRREAKHENFKRFFYFFYLTFLFVILHDYIKRFYALDFSFL